VFGLFIYQGTVPNTSGYMSDPDVFVDGDNRYLTWADGDGSNCGGLKSAKLNSDMRTLVSGTTQTLTVNGLGVLGDCGGKGRPYLEGPSLYKWNFNNPVHSWNLFFAAKPTSVPTECNANNTGKNSANTTNEVIAWATADLAQGPFTYRGIIMCGSTTEWTNQATITSTSNGRMIIIYHDGPAAPNRQRKLHAECLYLNFGEIGGVYRQAQNAPYGFDNCTQSNANSAFEGLRAEDPQQPGLPTIISTLNGGGDLKANRYAVGPWERYRFELVTSPDTYAIRSLANNQFVCGPANNVTPLAPTCTSASGTALFIKQNIVKTEYFRLLAASGGGYVSIAADAKLYVGTDFLGAATFLQLSP
jgi:hypothetical protein